MNLKILLLLITTTIFQTNCTTEPEVTENKIVLKEIGIAVKEAYLKIEVEKANTNQVVTLKRNGQTVLSYNTGITDTVLIDSGLVAGSNYNYQAEITEYGNLVTQSQRLNLQTLQPTSHEFSWEIIKLGDPSTSELWDVAIIDEDNIWAVGEIYLKDSTGKLDPNAYNLIHWNGSEWELLRLLFYTFCGQTFTGSYPTKSIMGFSKNDIWITSGSQITHYDGKNQLRTGCIPVSVNKLWGTDANDLYAGGNSGSIAHYQNGEWQKVASGTEGNITSVWGITDEDNGDEYLYYTIPSENKLLRIKNKQKIESTGWKEDKLIADIWGTKNELLYGAGEGGVYRKLGNKWEQLEIGIKHFFVSIGAQSLNDIIVCGISGAVSHYNGISWKDYPELQSPSLYLRQVAIKGNVVVMVGIDSQYAVIIMGKRTA